MSQLRLMLPLGAGEARSPEKEAALRATPASPPDSSRRCSETPTALSKCTSGGLPPANAETVPCPPQVMCRHSSTANPRWPPLGVLVMLEEQGEPVSQEVRLTHTCAPMPTALLFTGPRMRTSRCPQPDEQTSSGPSRQWNITWP
jgi:hypothetical protein